jgi:formylglycine-generating enzyme
MPLELQSLEPRLALAVADTIAPTVKSIAAPKPQTYGAGRPLSFKVTFTENVVVTGMPTLPVQMRTVLVVSGDAVRQAVWNGKGSGGKSLVFTITVQPFDVAPTGVSIAGPIGLSGGATIRDKAGNALIPTATGTFSKVVVDAFGPFVMTFGSPTVTPKRVSLQVTFNEPVTVKGKPSIPFTLAGTPKQLVYSSGSRKNVLTFSYKPAKGESPTAANVNLPTQAIALNRGAITDKVRNAAASLARPTDVQLSATSIPENQPSATVVGTLSAVDADGSRDSHTYALIAGAGSTDNASFRIVGNELQTFGPLDYEVKSSYSVRVRAADFGRLAAEKVFTITVTNVDDVVVQFVRVGDAGNAADTNPAGYGAVGYEYRIGTYEITIGQYTKFLNAVAKTDTYGLYSTSMGTDLNLAGISRSGSTGSYTYAVMNNGGDSSNRPIAYVSWLDAARFANWMHNGQPIGSQNANTTEDGAYTFTGAPLASAPAKNAGARFYIPTENEWYKAAYYKGGSTNAGYWDYATKSNSAPGNTIGSGANQANYWVGDFAVTQLNNRSASQNYLTNVGAFTGSQSAYGTFDQHGNVWEWNDLIGTAGSSRGLRGGNWSDSTGPFYFSSSFSFSRPPGVGDDYFGFRLASPV